MPTAQDFTPRAVQRAVQKEALQHPLTILPAAAAGVGMLSLLAFGPDPIAALATLGLGVLAAASWGFHYILNGERRAARHVAMLRERRRNHHREQVERLAEACDAIGFAAGAKEARELAAAWQKLIDFLHSRPGGERDNDNTGFFALAEAASNEGAGILRQALTVFAALRSVDCDQLEREVATWQAQLRSAPAGDRRALSSQIEVHQKRIAAYQQRQERLRQLLAEVNRLEGALETTYLQATELTLADGAASLRAGGAATELERAVAAARRTEEQLRTLETGWSDADLGYLDAAATTKTDQSTP